MIKEKKDSFDVAKDIASSKTVFTTHTPVPAGNDIFPLDLVEKYFKDYWNKLGLSKEEFLILAATSGIQEMYGFDMTGVGEETEELLVNMQKLVTKGYLYTNEEKFSLIRNKLAHGDFVYDSNTKEIKMTPLICKAKSGELFTYSYSLRRIAPASCCS